MAAFSGSDLAERFSGGRGSQCRVGSQCGHGHDPVGGLRHGQVVRSHDRDVVALGESTGGEKEADAMHTVYRSLYL
ncbi:hypothetical protein ACIBRY_04895 [Streptomyces anulatus]